MVSWLYDNESLEGRTCGQKKQGSPGIDNAGGSEERLPVVGDCLVDTDVLARRRGLRDGPTIRTLCQCVAVRLVWERTRM